MIIGLHFDSSGKRIFHGGEYSNFLMAYFLVTFDGCRSSVA
jgi:hypothetical protein